MSAIGILGGSFNPPHFGHQMMALFAIESGEVDSVLVIPTFQHALGKELAPYEARLEMCRLTMEPLGKRVEISDIESKREGASRTLDTLELLERRGHQDMRLLIGADILAETHLWHRWDAVARLAPPLVFRRHGYEGGVLLEPPNVSSTALRKRLKSRDSAQGLAPASVLSYIAKQGLYR